MTDQDKQSLRRYLTIPNPLLMGRKSGSRTNTNNSEWSVPHALLEWDDFDLQSLQSMYGGELKKVLDDERHSFRNFADVPPYPFCQIADESSFERFLVKWTQSVITEALEVAQRDGILRKPSTIYMVSGGQAKYKLETNLPVKTNTARKSYPDWAAIRFQEWSSTTASHQNTEPAFIKSHSLLPGDTKISAKWTSAKVRPGKIKKLTSCLRPVVQIFNYCLATKSRYGYLITDQELFVVRIRPARSSSEKESNDREVTQSFESSEQGQEGKDDSEDTNEEPVIIKKTRLSGVIEYKSIPWDSSGENELTVNLALFWLHILASIENTIQGKYNNLSEEKIHAAGEHTSDKLTEESPTATSSVNNEKSKSSFGEAPRSAVSAYQTVHKAQGSKRSRTSDQQMATRNKRRHYDSDE